MQPNQGILKKIYPMALLTLVILASVVLLSFTNAWAEPLITALADKAKVEQLKVMFPDMTTFTSSADKSFDTIKQGDKTIGYAFTASGNGYGGPITILVGLQDATTVKGISIIAQTETNGMGSRVTLPRFTDQFSGKAITDIKIKSDGGAIDGWTGSTISSKAVINAVREAALLKAAQIPK
jgi:Na+-translocating ferredoxin:NAD+ oxidoreductase subunit G